VTLHIIEIYMVDIDLFSTNLFYFVGIYKYDNYVFR